MTPYAGSNIGSQFAFTFESNSTPAHRDLITTTHPLERNMETEYALEIFSLFLLSICNCIEKVEGPPVSESLYTLRHSLFDTLAQKLVDSGLMLDLSDAMVYIIPAFAKFDLLPGLNTDSP